MYSIAGLIEAGFDVVPTFPTPHVTLTWMIGLEEGVAQLDPVDHDRRAKPYHG
ncbi:hypothetical protein [Iamia sp.]|uniref:hypothetical protein n=1 Tax=Iamia sp. TaxID=2722710 RepID=UPI002D80A420|nr:hypothetical protein [Iamia sp.]